MLWVAIQTIELDNPFKFQIIYYADFKIALLGVDQLNFPTLASSITT